MPDLVWTFWRKEETPGPAGGSIKEKYFVKFNETFRMQGHLKSNYFLKRKVHISQEGDISCTIHI